MRLAVTSPTAVPTIDTVQYSSGDLVGTKLSFNVADWKDDGGCVLDGVVISDLAGQGADLDLVLFETDPSATTFTNNAALDIADADLTKVIGVVPLTTDHAFADNGVTALRGVGLPIAVPPNHNGTIYGALVSRGTPTYATAADLQVRLNFRRT